jgi:hypothetical protein
VLYGTSGDIVRIDRFDLLAARQRNSIQILDPFLPLSVPLLTLVTQIIPKAVKILCFWSRLLAEAGSNDPQADTKA